jgi:hypothetical protein
MLGGGAKSMRFVALVAVAVAATGSPVESMAATLSKASGLMTSGVKAYIRETENGRSERQAHALIDSSETVTPHERALEDVEDKALEMAKAMLLNLERLAKAAEKIEKTVKAEHEAKDRDAKNHQESSGILSGKAERLQKEVDGLRETNHDLEDEKRSLIDSVQQMLHGSKKEELKACHSKVDETLQSLKEAKDHGAQIEKQLRDDNDALTSSLQKCHEEKTATEANAALSVQPGAVVLGEVECKDKLRTLELKQADDEDKREQVEKTVTLLMRSNEQLKEQVAKKGAAPVASTPAPRPRLDVAHMAETTKMDMYISQSEGELAAISQFNPKVAQTTKVAAAAAAPAAPAPAPKKAAAPAAPAPAPAKEVPVHHLRLSVKAQKEAQSAVTGEGIIGKYLRGETQKQIDDDDAAAAHNTTASLDRALQQLQVADSVEAKAQPAALVEEKDDDGDDLARKLLLQAEHNLKLAA